MIISAVQIGIPFSKKKGSASPAPTDTWTSLTDSTTTIRRYVLNGYCYTDKTLTPTGFSGTEGVDWIHVDQINITV